MFRSWGALAPGQVLQVLPLGNAAQPRRRAVRPTQLRPRSADVGEVACRRCFTMSSWLARWNRAPRQRPAWPRRWPAERPPGRLDRARGGTEEPAPWPRHHPRGRRRDRPRDAGHRRPDHGHTQQPGAAGPGPRLDADARLRGHRLGCGQRQYQAGTGTAAFADGPAGRAAAGGRHSAALQLDPAGNRRGSPHPGLQPDPAPTGAGSARPSARTGAGTRAGRGRHSGAGTGRAGRPGAAATTTCRARSAASPCPRPPRPTPATPSRCPRRESRRWSCRGRPRSSRATPTTRWPAPRP